MTEKTVYEEAREAIVTFEKKTKDERLKELQEAIDVCQRKCRNNLNKYHTAKKEKEMWEKVNNDCLIMINENLDNLWHLEYDLKKVMKSQDDES